MGESPQQIYKMHYYNYFHYNISCDLIQTNDQEYVAYATFTNPKAIIINRKIPTREERIIKIEFSKFKINYCRDSLNDSIGIEGAIPELDSMDCDYYIDGCIGIMGRGSYMIPEENSYIYVAQYELVSLDGSSEKTRVSVKSWLSETDSLKLLNNFRIIVEE
jgi:hypothetical protein